MNQWNDLVNGLLSGGAAVVDAWKDKIKSDALDGLYGKVVGRLNDVMKPMSEHVAGSPSHMGMGQFSGMYQEMNNAQVDPQAGLKTLYEGIQQMIPYGKDAEPYSQMLQNLYSSKLPSTELKTVGNDLLQVTKSPEGQYKVNPVYQGQTELTPDAQIPIRITATEDGKYVRTQYFKDKYGNNQVKTTPATLQDYNDQVATDMSKSLSWLDKENIKQQDKIDFHMSFGNGNGKIKAPKYDPNIDAEALKKQIKDLHEMNQLYDVHSKDIEWKTKYDLLQKDVKAKLPGWSDSDVRQLTDDIGKSGEKEALNKITSMLNEDGKNNPETVIQAGKQKAIDYANKIKEIAGNLQKSFLDLNTQLTSGQIDQSQFIAAIQNWYNKNGGSLPPEIMEEFKKHITDNKIPIKF